MRLTNTLLRKGKLPPNPKKIPFKEMFPVQLKNEVSGAGQKSADVSCLEEMAVMFACMKKNEFKEVKCTPEIEKFMGCYHQHRADGKAAKQRQASGVVTVGRNPRNLTTQQLNQLLRKHPQFNEKLPSW
ncbi:coiled-coil-helix-coiled-coil-helix domain-containing protein 1 [Folsomia candida]|uniref:coiled-coil-helix-coiled-coil-helix domain-containing protein 1 n=1 Tax=Folsomia candida TaxID=158441 RepID=UPI000B8F7840|nr:coiled-coil-helix-coiled-coil-helix domain-containing protein 1 [Folsomia candida]